MTSSCSDTDAINTDSHGRRGDWMQTYSGKKFFPIDPRPEDIDIIDVSHALSMVCRFAGQCKQFYSVAQHSVLVSQNVSSDAALWGLLHDAAEAYIGDLTRPLKRCLETLVGRLIFNIEETIQHCIIRAFNVRYRPAIAAEVKRADDLLVVTEARDLMAPLTDGWRHTPENGFAVLSETIIPWEPARARSEFFNRFCQLKTT